MQNLLRRDRSSKLLFDNFDDNHNDNDYDDNDNNDYRILFLFVH